MFLVKRKKLPHHKAADTFLKVFRNVFVEPDLSSEYICVDDMKDKMYLRK